MKNYKKNKAMIFKVDSQSPEVAELLECIENRSGLLSKYIREVHDFAVHFSNIDIEDDMKSMLYFMRELSDLIEEIEITSPAKK